jgi:hypothetical protein
VTLLNLATRKYHFEATLKLLTGKNLWALLPWKIIALNNLSRMMKVEIA